jgi:hypothetical protein
MMGFDKSIPALAVAFILTTVSTTRADNDLTLRNDFIETYKNRLTIDATLNVVETWEHAKPITEDGDTHSVGTAAEIELTTVAEIMNAKDEQDSVDHFVAARDSGNPVKITGVWRIWFEHAKSETQGEPLDPIIGTGAAHLFEIHPVTKVKNKVLLGSLRPNYGYDTHKAYPAFSNIKKRKCTIIPHPENGTTTIRTTRIGYNYVEFLFELLEEPAPIGEVLDGRIVYGAIRTLNGKYVVKKARAVFVKDSNPEVVVRNAHAGGTMHVLGIPRISLANVSWRATTSSSRPEILTWKLPYEVIIVGVY